nr:hypothetical protein [Tanacetum cinerariifolium]
AVVHSMVASITTWSMRASQDDIDAYKAYWRYVSGDFAYFDCIDTDEFSVHELNDMVKKIDAAYNTPKHKCLIMEIPEGVTPINASPNDAHVIDESSSRPEDGESSHPNTANPTTQTNFANDLYSALDPYLEVKDFDPFFDDDQIHVEVNGNSDGDTSESSEHDEFVDTDNQLVDLEVDMDHFDTANAKIMINDGTHVFNANEVFDIGIDVIDTEEFESAYDEDRIERIRRRKMKHLKKHNNFKEGGLQNVHFLVGHEFPNSVVVKDLVPRHSIKTRIELYLKKNDKVRVRAACKGTIYVFNNSYDIGPSNIVESSQPTK